MKRVLKLRKSVKYTILFLIDLIFVFNLPLILKNSESLNDYRYNMMILFALFISNAIALTKIENN